MAQIIVATGKVVSYDGNLLYGRDEAYTVKDTYENEVKANKDASANLISIVEQFTATTTTDVTEVNLVTGDSVDITNKADRVLGQVTVNGSLVEDATLQDAVTGANNGTAYAPAKANMLLSFSIRGTSSSRTVVFEMAGPSNVFQACKCFSIYDPTATPASSTTGGNDTTPEAWQVSIPVGWQFRARVSAVSGGNVTITGKAVS